MSAYYNEFDPFAAAWLRELIKAGHIAPGEVDERSITEVKANELKGFTQCHFFAGIGGWSYALRLAGWPDDRPVWTGSCPCQPFSTAGNGKGKEDTRHLWPVWLRLIRECSPATVFGEQVASAIAHGWLDDVYQGLEAQGYAVGAAVLPACSVGAPHRRDRLWFVADAAGAGKRREQCDFHEKNGGQIGQGLQQLNGPGACSVAYTQGIGQQQISQNASGSNERNRAQRKQGRRTSKHGGDGGIMADNHRHHGHWGGGPLQVGRNCIEGKIKGRSGEQSAKWLTKPGLGLLAHGVRNRVGKLRGYGNSGQEEEKGVKNRVGKLRGYGNAIVPQVAAEFIKASM